MSKVVIVKCTSYDGEQVYEALKRGMAYLGGITRFVSPEEKILLKPNMLRSKKKRGCTTHRRIRRRHSLVGRVPCTS